METVRRLRPLGIAILTIVALACTSKREPAGDAAQALLVSTPAGARAWRVGELQKLPRRQVDKDRSRYGGARLTDVIGKVPAGASVVVRGRDGYTQTISAVAATRDDCLVAFEKDGHALAASDGPIRMIVPGSRGLSIRNVVAIAVLTR